MKDLSRYKVLVLDMGKQIAVAERLSRDFGQVDYWNPSVINGFEGHEAKDIGRGVAGINKVTDWEDYKEDYDLFVFTDIYMNGLQESLRREGKIVFGSGKAANMEKDRDGFKQLLINLELPVNEYDTATGVLDLMDKLREVEDKYIKSSLRGDMETFHHQNFTLSKMELRRMNHDMGVYANREKYIIENPIDAIGEIGYDGFCINGAYPEQSCCGIEIKDVGYVGKMVKYANLPSQVTDSLNKLAPVFMDYGYKGAFSTEIRVDKKKVGYFIDPTFRFPEPNTSLILEMYDNFSEIIWDVANGIVPKIESSYLYGVEFIIKSEMAKTMPVAIQFPEEYKKYIKIKNLVVDEEGVSWFTTNGVPLCEIGAVVGMGATMEAAVTMAKSIAGTVKGFDLKINTDCISEAQKQIKELTKNGIRFI